jgi:DNA invertase Pin-like site-specific DNA recombinase
MHAPVRAIAYRRVSKGEQAAAWKTSLATQTSAVLELAIKLGVDLRDELIFEDRFSGEDVEGRPGFRALIEYCRAHPQPRSAPGYALFYNDSRFGRFRDPGEAPYWRVKLSKTGWIVRFCVNDDTENTTARHIIRAVGEAQASEYLDNLRRNTRNGARGAAALGLWQNEAPFGYRRLASAPGRPDMVLDIGQRKSDDQTVRLTPDPDGEVEILRWMFETYAAGKMSLGTMVLDVRRRAPRLKWSKANLSKMLRNRTYLGEVIWCRRPHDKQERVDTPVRPPEEWVVVEGAHPAIITPELFAAVQARLERNRREVRARASVYPLSGLVKCATCGARYVGGGGVKNHKDPSDPDRYRFYREAGDTYDKPPCGSKWGTVTRRVLEPAVVAEIARSVSDPVVQKAIRAEVDRRVAELRAGGEQPLRDARKEEQAAEDARERLVRSIRDGLVTDGEARGAMEEARDRIQRAKQEVNRREHADVAARDLEAERERLVVLAADFPARARAATGPELRELIEPWIESATFDKDTRELVLAVRVVPSLQPSRAAPRAAVQRRLHLRAAPRSTASRRHAPNHS